MTDFLKYRISALLLSTLFLVFNVGLPIVVTACPMHKASMKPSCCVQHSPVTGNHFRTEKDNSCCKTTILSERNTTEFVESKYTADELNSTSAVQPVVAIVTSLDQLAFTLLPTTSSLSPPTSVEKYVLTGTFLI
jgi:hypothetical protein